MKPFQPTKEPALGLALMLLAALGLTPLHAATTRHVWPDSPSPAPPYDTWATAAHVFQDAVDAAVDGDTVLVTNGVYASGGRAVSGTMTNRVAIDRAITVQSVNGPEGTLIVGYGPGATNGDGAIRCVYLGTNAVLSGFTLTNGHTRVSGDWANEQTGGGVWCAATNALVTNCTLIGNSADYGGGAYQGTLYYCMVTANTAGGGGGLAGSTVYNCALTGNLAQHGGGGVFGGVLTNCTLTGNRASDGGGVHGYDTLYTLYNCRLTGNSATGASGSGGSGGGAYGCKLYNCTLGGNSARQGGGAFGGQLDNCTVAWNTATQDGGGVGGGSSGSCSIRNCIVYNNSAPIGPNYAGSTLFRYSCSTPLPTGGFDVGNISNDPQLASTTHLSTGSPCIGTGSSNYSSGVDIDGEPWADPPCMGADQLTLGSASGPLAMSIRATYTRFAVGFAAPFVADNTGPITGSVWDFGDGTLVTNQAFVSHGWASPGTYEVRLTGYNDSHLGGVATALTVEVVEEVYYVNAANAAPLLPYTNWQTAASTIQDAIGVSSTPGRLVLVTNGIYAQGGVAVVGTMTNRAALINAVRVQSVNGPEVTVIVGYGPGGTNGDGAIRCACIGADAFLSGFTLTNGHTRADGDTFTERSGGGAWSEITGVVTNCIISSSSAANGAGAYGGTLRKCMLSGNSTLDAPGNGGGAGARSSILVSCAIIGNSSGYGGGAMFCTLNNCVVAGNSASSGGGGTRQCTLYNCVLVGNSASRNGGGAYESTLYNCIVYQNSPANHMSSTVRYSCTTPGPASQGNITNAPLFVDQAAGDFRLLPGSPCIDAGTNLSALLTTDLDGLPRPLDGNGDGVAAFDMGAYEFLLPTADSNGDGIPDGWTLQHGLNPCDPAVGAANPDGDAHTTFEEWQADTDPTDAHSCFRIESISGGSPVTVYFQSSSNRVYTLRSATNLTAGILSEVPGQADVPGSGVLHSLADTNAGPARFYRVGVRVP